MIINKIIKHLLGLTQSNIHQGRIQNHNIILFTLWVQAIVIPAVHIIVFGLDLAWHRPQCDTNQ